eukprot:TRINITY_DN56297_c0_g1_i1.p1 TRINITY_DN56297_c0_g1~~TRINITY_DN56297_c0_g1_i1.p1  ORF type:complete len:154 (+),score=63.17 TRINITY_DN56297_c0_g1_i1:78-539(+)
MAGSEAEWVEAWDLFDRPPRSGKLPKDKVRHCVRGTGRLYTEEELEALLKDYPDPMEKSQYLTAMRQPYEPPSHSILTAIKAFDGKEKGEVSEADVTAMLTGSTVQVPHALLSAALHGAAFDKGKIATEALAAHFEQGWREMDPTLQEVLAAQ